MDIQILIISEDQIDNYSFLGLYPVIGLLSFCIIVFTLVAAVLVYFFKRAVRILVNSSPILFTSAIANI
jgi:hypothetical protein